MSARFQSASPSREEGNSGPAAAVPVSGDAAQAGTQDQLGIDHANQASQVDALTEVQDGLSEETLEVEGKGIGEPELQPQDMFVGGSVLALLGASLLPLADGILARSTKSTRIRGAVFFARWGFGHVAGAMSVWILLSLALSLVFSVVEPCFLGLLLAGQLTMGGLAFVACLQARRLQPEGLAGLGLAWRGSRGPIFGALLVYVLCLPVLYGAVLLWPGLAEMFGHTIEPQAVAQGIVDLSGISLGLAILVAVAVAPLFEEIVFRGYLQPLLVQNLHAPAGIFVTSVLFASLHGDAFGPILVLSMLLGWIQWRTHSTLACVAVHMLHNGINLSLLLLSSGVSP